MLWRVGGRQLRAEVVAQACGTLVLATVAGLRLLSDAAPKGPSEIERLNLIVECLDLAPSERLERSRPSARRQGHRL